MDHAPLVVGEALEAGAGDVLGRGGPGEKGRAHPRAVGKARVDGARAQARHVDARPAHLGPQRVGEGEDVGLGRGVDREARRGHERRRARHVEHAAAGAPHHARQEAPRERRERRHVQAHHAVDGLDGGVEKRALVAEPGVVDEDVDRETLGFQAVDERGGGAVRLQVGLEDGRLPAALADVVGDRREGVFAAGDEHDVRAGRAELAGHVGADARRGAGDEGRAAAVEGVGHGGAGEEREGGVTHAGAARVRPMPILPKSSPSHHP